LRARRRRWGAIHCSQAKARRCPDLRA
jgi:hypothetical protein